MKSKNHISPTGAMRSPFADMAYSLYLFTKRLHAQASARKLSDLYFFSREGKMLKDMFDLYVEQSNSPVRIRTHYLEVSRRSTFLPSLHSLENETFEVLFRQYRRMSLSNFLKSLALDEHVDVLSEATGIGRNEFDTTRNDLPTSVQFGRLLAAPDFQTIYERERALRSNALAAYVASFNGGVLPKSITIVDVGWKGSIQDNLFNWFQQAAGPDAFIDGYYVGLIAKGLANARNRKTGLLFSAVPKPSPGFSVFNESRSLFEVLLPACHGGPRSYEIANRQVHVIRDPFDEKDMIETLVNPVAGAVLNKFKHLAKSMSANPPSDGQLLSQVRKRHARMVFKPTPSEIDWMFSVSHVENFGEFKESRFGNADDKPSLIERCHYTWKLLARRQLDDPGFWPYLTLRRRALFGAHAAYRVLRTLQGRRTRERAEHPR